MLYNNCRELPIHNFFEISRTNDLKHLVKSGEIPDEEILQEKFIDIIDEYNGLFKNNKNPAQTVRLQLYVLTLKLSTLEVIEMIIESTGISEDVREICRKLRVKPERIKDYFTGLHNDIRKLEKQIQDQGETETNESDILEKTLTLLKENGFNFDRFTTPIIEFAFAVNRMEEKANKAK